MITFTMWLEEETREEKKTKLRKNWLSPPSEEGEDLMKAAVKASKHYDKKYRTKGFDTSDALDRDLKSRGL